MDIEYNHVVEKKLYALAESHLQPIYGVLELTPLCNMNCDMCYVRLSRKEMAKKGKIVSLEKWLMLANEMKEAGVLFILLTGGEPLLYPYFKELYLALLNMGMVITVNTNGTLIDDKWIDFFSLHKPRRINISLYGSDKDYDRLCHNVDGHAKAINAIKQLKKSGIAVKMNYSIVKENSKSIDLVYQFAKNLNVPIFFDSYMCPATRERSQTFAYQSRLTPQEAARIRVLLMKKQMGNDFITYVKRFLELAYIDKKTKLKEGMNCKAGKCSFMISWHGFMRPCVIMDAPSIPVLEVGFNNAWKTIVEKTSQIFMSEKCSQCTLRKICHVCPSYSLLEAGAYDRVPRYLCEYTKYTIEYFKEELKLMEPDI